MSERMIYGLKPRVFHIVDDGATLCGISSLMMWRVRRGQKGDGLPCCLKCGEKEDARRRSEEKKP